MNHKALGKAVGTILLVMCISIIFIYSLIKFPIITCIILTIFLITMSVIILYETFK